MGWSVVEPRKRTRKGSNKVRIAKSGRATMPAELLAEVCDGDSVSVQVNAETNQIAIGGVGATAVRFSKGGAKASLSLIDALVDLDVALDAAAGAYEPTIEDGTMVITLS